MENFAQAFREFDSKSFLGKNGFVWWYGVVEDRHDPLYLGRVKVRCIGWHTDDKTPGSGIPTEDLPWADVINPITSASMSGIGRSPTGIVPGTHVFGFFRDGNEGQEPVVLGTLNGIPERLANPERGFFDPRSARQREQEPHPPMFIERTAGVEKSKIINHFPVFSSNLKDGTKLHKIQGASSWAKHKSYLELQRDDISQKAEIVVKGLRKGINTSSYTTSYDPGGDEFVRLGSYINFSAHPNENRTQFNQNGFLDFSLPTTNILASANQKSKNTNTDQKNPFTSMIFRTHRINQELEDYRNALHTNVETTNPDKKINQPGSTGTLGEPSYPFNHVTYSESGHLFEMDDTPGKERVRLMHRSTSYIEYLNDGDRVDNTVGKKYDMVDSDMSIHALGNSFTSINGFYDLYVKGNAKTVSPSPNDSTASSAFNIKVGSGNASLVTDNGDINIVAGGNGRVILKGTDVVFTSGDGKPIDQKTFGLDNYNLKGVGMGSVELRSKSMNLRSEGALQLNSSNHNIVTGDYTINANKTIKMSATFGAKETINGLLTLGIPGEPNVGKQINILGGKMEVNSINPLGGFDVNVGPVGSLTSSSMNALGYKVDTLGQIKMDAKLGMKFDTLLTYNVDAKTALSLKTAMGEMSLSPPGQITLKGPAFSLGALLDELMTALAQLTVPTGTGPSGPPINAAALQAVQQKLGTLLSK